MRALTSWAQVRDRVTGNRQLPHVRDSNTRGYRLDETRRVLLAIRHSADAEYRDAGYEDAMVNPIDVMMGTTSVPPFFHRMANAISQARDANAFGPRPATETAFVRGARVRLVRRPNDDVGLPQRIGLNAQGTLVAWTPAEDTIDDGWEVEFDDHGHWWTPTATLELL